MTHEANDEQSDVARFQLKKKKKKKPLYIRSLTRIPQRQISRPIRDIREETKFTWKIHSKKQGK